MGCSSCGGRARAARSATAPTYQYLFTPPDGGDPITYLNPIEGKKAVRRHGGGELRRIAVPAPPASTVPS